MEIKDISGLGQPLAKLIEIVSSGVGRLSRTYFSKKDADAKAYQIRKLAEALNDSRKLLGTGSYSNEGLSVSFTEQPDALLLDSSLEERSLARYTYQEAKKQLNIENITQHAAEELREKEIVSNEKVDEDWIARFFKIAEDIGSEEMQVLWGKVLAGEVSRPKSYSLRTLDTLKNITTAEAEVFAKVAQAALITWDEFAGSDATFIFNPDKRNFEHLNSEFGITFLDLLLLREIGLIQSAGLEYRISRGGTFFLVYGSKCVIVERQAEVPKQSFPVAIYTNAGAELVPLVSITENTKYIQRIAAHIKTDGVVVRYAGIISRAGSQIKYADAQEVPPL
jgi:uncharacterized repeat protein (TIGR03899 family)